MGFGPSFRQLILLFYTDVESAVIVNSWTSPFFQPSRSVRQGCPLSPLLYVLCTEVLAYNLRASSGIAGVHLPNSAQELLVSGYANDTMVVITTVPCRLYAVPSVQGRIWCQAEPFQIQGVVVGRMETSL